MNREAFFSEIYNNIVEFEDTINALTYLHYKQKEEAIEVSSSRDDLPLRGSPVIVKDTIKTKGIPTTAGSKKYSQFVPTNDAEIIKRIRRQGGIIFAKSNTPEFALDYQTYNDLHGITSNPHDIDKTAGGSSGGSAAALAAGYADYAIGSDLGGSLRQPASFCGIVSLRPTFRTIPDEGQLPQQSSNHIATLGPMGTSVSATARLFAAMMEREFEELTSLDLDDITFLGASHLEQIPLQTSIKRSLLSLFFSMETNNIDVEKISSYLNYNRIKSVYLALSKNFVGEETVEPIDFYLDERRIIREEFENLLADHDGFILPVASVQPYEHNLSHNDFVINNETVNYWVANGGYCQLGSVLGNPVVTLPVGTINGLPLGIQIIGRMEADLDLLNIAYTLEQKLISTNPVGI